VRALAGEASYQLVRTSEDTPLDPQSAAAYYPLRHRCVLAHMLASKWWRGYCVNKSRIYILTLMFIAALACSVEMYDQVNAPMAAGTVRLWITATEMGHPVNDLKKEDLQLWIGKQEQSISVLAFNPPEPLKVGLLIDTSGSRRAQWPGPEISLAPGFFRQVIRPGDQAFIIDFNTKPLIDADLTGDLSVLDHGLERLAAVRPYRGSALYDAIEAACDQREAGGPTHRALVVITDGVDNSSMHRLDQAMVVVRRTGTQLYVIGTVFEPFHSESTLSRSALEAAYTLRSIARATGGRFFPTSNKHEMESGFNSIVEVLRAQYALEFQPAAVSPGKKGNRIEIKCSRSSVKVIAPEEY